MEDVLVAAARIMLGQVNEDPCYFVVMIPKPTNLIFTVANECGCAVATCFAWNTGNT